MSHNNLGNYYDVIFSMVSQGQSKFSVTEVENMIPFERDIYCMAIEKLNKDK